MSKNKYTTLKPVVKEAKPLTEVEHIKEKSNYLRGTIVESLENDITGALYPDDQQLIKFHGTYQQFDRELESERKKQKLEPLYSFLIRIRVPAGIVTPKQWLEIDLLTGKYGIGTIKLTTRQAFELHGVAKSNLRKTMQGINDSLLDTLAACGDVNRNVMAGAIPNITKAHASMTEVANAIHVHLTPKTKAYHEIWLNNEIIGGGEPDFEPIYGKTYLPRKFKIALAIPPINDTDVFANDVGLIGIVESGKLVGFNITAGGGMGMTFGMADTHPRLGDVLGFVPIDKVVDVVEKIVLIQRDNGGRTNRKYSRLKYTIERMGVEAFKAELTKRLGYTLELESPYKFTQSGDQFGWHKGEDGNWHYTMFVEGGRVKDSDKYKLREGLREIAHIHKGVFILTGNQNLVISNISEKEKKNIEQLLTQYGIAQKQQISGLRKNSMACVALNLCPLAFSEAERYLPNFIDKADQLLAKHGLENENINIRMTGCPNGCARPFLAEIGLVGRAPGRYNMYLGASHSGNRLNTLYRDMMNEQEILDTLNLLFEEYARDRRSGESFGDFVIRNKVVPEMTDSQLFQKVKGLSDQQTANSSNFQI